MPELPPPFKTRWDSERQAVFGRGFPVQFFPYDYQECICLCFQSRYLFRKFGQWVNPSRYDSPPKRRFASTHACGQPTKQ